MHGMWTVSKMAEDCVSTAISRIIAVLCLKARSTNELAASLAQLVERQSHNLKVASSSLAGSNSLLFVSLPLSLAFCLSHTLLTSAMRHLYKMVYINSATV